MKVRNLLLGSAAAMLAGGASTAQAADTAGLAVVTMATAAAYVELCNSTKGLVLRGWCITPTGKVSFDTKYGSSIDWDTDPWNASWSYDGWDNFNIASTASILAYTTGTDRRVTIGFPLGTSSTPSQTASNTFISISQLGMPTFAALRYDRDGVTVAHDFGDLDVNFRVGEPGTLAFKEDVWNTNGPWPDWRIGIGHTVAEGFTAEIHGGQRDNAAFGAWYTFGARAEIKFEVGPATIGARFDYDRVEPFSVAAVMNGFGARVGIKVDMDPVTFEVIGYVSQNYDPYGVYKYVEEEFGTYFAIRTILGAELMEGVMATLTTNFAQGPDAPFDRTLTFVGKLEWKPAAASPLTAAVTFTHERMLGGPGFNLSANRIGFEVAAQFN